MTPPWRPRWCGQDPAWWLPFESAARRWYGSGLQISYTHDRIEYRVHVDVLGRRETVPVLVKIYADPPYHCYDLAPQDYPRVYADVGAASPHRMPDGALCLYQPLDPPEQRWRSDHGLLALLELVRRHLLLEDGWRLTGGHAGGLWAGAEAPHGLPKQKSA
jgi:hypothetical protein